jgi:hypothetical protein
MLPIERPMKGSRGAIALVDQPSVPSPKEPATALSSLCLPAFWVWSLSADALSDAFRNVYAPVLGRVLKLREPRLKTCYRFSLSVQCLVVKRPPLLQTIV